MFPGRASHHHFLYHPKSQEILRDHYEKMYYLKFLFSHCVDLKFFCGIEHTAMTASVFDSLGGELQDTVMA